MNCETKKKLEENIKYYNLKTACIDLKNKNILKWTEHKNRQMEQNKKMELEENASVERMVRRNKCEAQEEKVLRDVESKKEIRKIVKSES